MLEKIRELAISAKRELCKRDDFEARLATFCLDSILIDVRYMERGLALRYEMLHTAGEILEICQLDSIKEIQRILIAGEVNHEND